VKGLGSRYGADCVLVGMEPTGLYWQPVYASLRRALPECGVYAVSPAVVAHSRYRRSSNLSKDDDRDALLIARAILHGECFRPIQHTPLTAQMREALWLYDRTRRAERQARQHLDTMLCRAFPEALHGAGPDAEDGIRRLLEESAAPSVLSPCRHVLQHRLDS
jgi:transposase